MKNCRLILALTLVLSALAGCTFKRGTLTVASAKNVNLNNAELEEVKVGAVGESYQKFIFVIPSGDYSIDAAVKDALDKHGGDLLMNVQIRERFWMIPWIYGKWGYQVTGDVYRIKR